MVVIASRSARSVGGADHSAHVSHLDFGVVGSGHSSCRRRGPLESRRFSTALSSYGGVEFFRHRSQLSPSAALSFARDLLPMIFSNVAHQEILEIVSGIEWFVQRRVRAEDAFHGGPGRLTVVRSIGNLPRCSKADDIWRLVRDRPRWAKWARHIHRPQPGR